MQFTNAIQDQISIDATRLLLLYYNNSFSRQVNNLVNELNLPDLFNSKPNQPNDDWLTALSVIETLLPQDLFQSFLKITKMSRFVKEVFCQYPEICTKLLVWHNQTNMSNDKIFLTEMFNNFCNQSSQIETPSVNPPAQMSTLDENQIKRELRVFRRCHAAAIALLELSNQISIESSCFKISSLADCLIEAAYHWSYQHTVSRFGAPDTKEGEPQSLVILLMGKLGGNELNFSSDIDLIFFYGESGQTSGASRTIENSRFFQRLSALLIKLLDEVTADGFVYRVDMRLRPYGDSGALVASFAQAEDYYQEQGREWERFAMLRARILTGSEHEIKQLENIIRPFSFRRYIDYGVIESIRGMKEMIQREVRRKGLVGNIKLGAGGIREVEFIVQSLQLIQGGRDRRLRERNTLKVLPLLVEAKLLPESVANCLAQSYRFLRRLEHCIQELAEKQTQQLPESAEERQALCIAMDFKNWQALISQLEKHQKLVNQHFNELFGEDRKKALTQDDFFQSLAEGHIDADELLAYLQQNKNKNKNFELVFDKINAEKFILRLNQFVLDSSVLSLSPRGAKRLKLFFPALLSACLQTKDPDLTLQRLLVVLQAILKRTAYLELLSENPPVLEHLVDLAGRSPWIVKRLSDYPVLFDELLYPNSLYEPLQTADLKAELQQNLLRIDPQDEEELLDAIRTFKQTNELRVAAALLAEHVSISQVSRYLTQLAEVVLQATVSHCWYLLTLQYGVPQSLSEPESEYDSEPKNQLQNNFTDKPHSPIIQSEPGGLSQHYGFAVIGYGKLGGYELGFDSDLDLVFLFDQPLDKETNGKRALANSRFYTRLAQKIIHFLSTRTNHGILYEVDMRLRPSGSSGLLVSHIDAYRDYQLESAWTWEHQALVRARFVAGDENINQAFQRIRHDTLTSIRDLSKLKTDVVDMRQKMKTQLEKHQAGKIDLKQTSGGLVDIEFLAQYFCLALQSQCLLGADQQKIDVIPNNTVEAIKLAANHQLISLNDSLLLIKCYRLFRNKLNEIALLENSGLVDEKLFDNYLTKVKLIWGFIFEEQQ